MLRFIWKFDLLPASELSSTYDTILIAGILLRESLLYIDTISCTTGVYYSTQTYSSSQHSRHKHERQTV